MVKTLLADLIDVEVLADVVTAGVNKKLQFTGLAEVNDDLEGVPGSKLRFPVYKFDGEATEVADGDPIPLSKLTASSTEVEVKQIGTGAEISDKSAMSAPGKVLDKAVESIILAIADKVDTDLLEAAKGTVQTAPSVNSVETLQAALDVFADDGDEPIGIILSHADAGALRTDAAQNFIQGSALGAERVATGVYGDVLGVQILRSQKLKKGEFYLIKQGALAIVSKRDVEVESDRDIVSKTTVITGDKHYAAYLYNPAGVVKAADPAPVEGGE